MRRFSRWSISHRRWVVVGWVAVAILVTVISQTVGHDYASDFSLPGTDSQQAQDLLSAKFPQQSGDSDTIVFHVRSGSVDDASTTAAIKPLLARVSRMPHVVGVVSPYSAAGQRQVSANRRTAFATVQYAKRANALPDDTGKPVLHAVGAVHAPGLEVAAGGQVMENAEGFSTGPATLVGVIAALVILLITFGSLLAAGLPLITAAFGLIVGTGLIGLATQVTSMASVSPDLALMIGLGVGIDYALFIVTRFRESHDRLGDVDAAVMEAMNTSGRAVLLAGATVVIALLGMFATGVSFMYGLAIAAVLGVLMVLGASLTVLPALLSRFGHRIVRPTRASRRRQARSSGERRSFWHEWAEIVRAHPWSLAIASLVVIAAFVVPFFSMRLDNSDAGNDPTSTSTQRAFAMLSDGFGPGFNGPLLLVAELPRTNQASALDRLATSVRRTPDVRAVTTPVISSDHAVAVMRAYPDSAPQAEATTQLVHRLRDDVLPPVARATGTSVLVGGVTAASVDFAHVLSAKLPLFIALVVVLSALLLFVIFRSIVIPIQAAVMNLLSIGGALGATVAAFQWGWLDSILGISGGPIEPWIPVIIFAVVFGLSMDYEVFLISRVREQWVRTGDARGAVGEAIGVTGRVITAAAAIMICVFLSFLLGDERTLKEFGFGLAAAVLLDAIVVRCVLLPAVLQILGPLTWRLPGAWSRRLPHLNIEGVEPAPAPEQI